MRTMLRAALATIGVFIGILVGILMIAVVIGGLCSAGSQGQQALPGSPNSSISPLVTVLQELAAQGKSGDGSPPSSSPTTSRIGETVKLGSIELTVKEVTSPVESSDQFNTPRNDHVAVIDVHLSNISSTQVTVSAIGSFELRDEEGYQYPWTTIPNAPATALNGTVGPGGKLAGSLAYDVTAGKRYSLYYRGLLFSSDEAIIELGEL